MVSRVVLDFIFHYLWLSPIQFPFRVWLGTCFQCQFQYRFRSLPRLTATPCDQCDRYDQYDRYVSHDRHNSFDYTTVATAVTATTTTALTGTAAMIATTATLARRSIHHMTDSRSSQFPAGLAYSASAQLKMQLCEIFHKISLPLLSWAHLPA